MKTATKVYIGCLVAAVLAQLGIIAGIALGVPDDGARTLDIVIFTPMNCWTMWLTQREIRKDWHRKPKTPKPLGPPQERLP